MQAVAVMLNFKPMQISIMLQVLQTYAQIQSMMKEKMLMKTAVHPLNVIQTVTGLRMLTMLVLIRLQVIQF